MYEETDAELARILKLVESCPEALQAKAFEILLEGYVRSLSGTATPAPPAPPKDPLAGRTPPPPSDESWKEGIPEEVLPRFQTMATRLKVSPEKLADVFDFSTDPFGYAAIHVEGKSARERQYRVAMLVAARGFLATGRWTADWSEIKAMCTHQSCYQVNNFAGNLANAEGEWFKTVTSGANVQTNAAGQKEAERLLVELAGGADAAQE